MAYETEKNRLAALLTSVVGITRTRDSDLEREADERAHEARLQTGLNSGPEDGDDAIAHPTAAERRARLGVPSTVITSEIATWNYMWLDPVGAAADGWLQSPPHRNELDTNAYTHWGIGIYTEMPPGETNELFRRWWFIIWFANQSIGSAALSKPTELVSKRVSFAAGTHVGYKFDYTGKILSTKTFGFATSSSAQSAGRGRIPNRSGEWLLIANGGFAGLWVEEDSYVTQPHPKLV